MAELGFSLFETSIGCCGIVWGERGIVGVQLPEARNSATRARLLERFPEAREIEPPLAVRRARTAISGLLRGEATDLSTVVLDMQHVPAFHQRVYTAVRKITPGQTLSYGEIATQLGDRLLARDVGTALGKNPFPIIVPCHRVLAAGGKMGGFSAPGGVATKLKLLSIERAAPNGPTLFDELPLVARRSARA
jgi:methylated-DNA-[protein]-cysteine S-methyltransferase